jgi:hypothetical protein
MVNNSNEYCHNCGVAIREPSAFCGRCGTALPDSQAGQAEASAATSGPEQVAGSARATGERSARLRSATAVGDAQRRGSTPPRAAAAPPRQAQPPRGTPSPPASPQGGAQPPAMQPLPPGAPPPPEGAQTGGARRWIPFAAIGGGIVLIAAVVAVLLIALGGSAGKDVKGASATRTEALQLLAANGTTTVSRVAPGLFALATTGKLTTIVPAGWRATAQAANGAARAEFADTKNSNSTLTIVANKGGQASDHRRALSARSAVKKRGYSEGAFGAITFPGGREVWRVSYVKAGVTHETFFYSACQGAAAMVVDVSATSNSFTREQPTLRAAAASAEPVC